MKIIAFYLPQFHVIPENNSWWGEDFTDWETVRNAKPLFAGHNQPRIPLGKNYYDLLDKNVLSWQCSLAKDYGVYGFAFYHYWFSGKLLLEKPLELVLSNKALDLRFCICWANTSWTKQWIGENQILIPQEYGQEEVWKSHFEYLQRFFVDERYIWVDNKPLLIIHRPELIPCLNDMFDFWNGLAIKSGFPGISFAGRSFGIESYDISRFTYIVESQPGYSRNVSQNTNFSLSKRMMSKTMRWVKERIKKVRSLPLSSSLKTVDYNEEWEIILNTMPKNDKFVPGAFVDWDNTPRYGKKGRVFLGVSPEKFEQHLSEQVKRAKSVYNKDMIFLFAWNEWAEGGYLEPDEKTGYCYLEAIRKSLMANNEFPL